MSRKYKTKIVENFFLQIHGIYGSLHRYTRRGRNILRSHFLLIVLTLKSNEEVTICFYRVFSRVYTMIPAQTMRCKCGLSIISIRLFPYIFIVLLVNIKCILWYIHLTLICYIEEERVALIFVNCISKNC